MSDFVDFGYTLESTELLEPEDFMTDEEMEAENYLDKPLVSMLEDEELNKIADERADGPFIPIEIDKLDSFEGD